MKKTLFILLSVGALTVPSIHAQTRAGDASPVATASWPLTVSLQFHSLSMPFQDLKTTFSNVGIGLGTEFNYNRRGNLIQTVQVGYYRNRYAGDGLFVSTQAGYRPHFGHLYTEFKVGVGWNYTVHPNATIQLREGQWHSLGRTGKGLLMVPIGISIGYAKPKAFIAPFVAYQFFALSGYNPSVPLVPNQLLQAGTHIYFAN